MKPINVMRFKQAAAGGATDPFFSSVVALLHFDGPNGSTTFTDQKGTIWTVNGTPVIQTARSKFGGAAATFATGYITSPTGTSYSFGTGDWTVEAWLRIDDPADIVFLDLRPASTPGIVFYITVGAPGVYCNDGGISTVVSPTTISDGLWHHVAYVRSGTTCTIYVDGVASGTTSMPNDLSSLTKGFIGANNSGGQLWYGDIDDMRITKGVARYTTNFSVPTTAFPNS